MIGPSRSLPWLLVIVTPLLFAVVAVLIAPGADTPWAARSFVDPLGTDEFGRDLLGTAIQAAGASLAKGLAITLVVMTLALVMAEVLTLVSSSLASIAIRGLSRVVESIPVVMWVMICVIVLEEFGGFVGGVVYAVVVLPGAINILAGELLRLLVCLPAVH